MARSRKSKVVWKTIGAVSAGAAIGGALGLLLSSASGTQDRKLVGKKTKKLVSTTYKSVVRAEKRLKRRFHK